MFITLKNATKKYGEGESLVYALDHTNLENIGSENCVYYVCYDEDNDIDFRKEVNQNYYMRTYIQLCWCV